MTTRMIVVHGGVGESMDKLDGYVKAAETGMERLLKGKDALVGAVAATVVFEDDPRFNCGTGSWPGMDLETIEQNFAAHSPFKAAGLGGVSGGPKPFGHDHCYPVPKGGKILHFPS